MRGVCLYGTDKGPSGGLFLFIHSRLHRRAGRENADGKTQHPAVVLGGLAGHGGSRPGFTKLGAAGGYRVGHRHVRGELVLQAQAGEQTDGVRV